MKMQKEKVKITYQNFLFELNFKTDYCLEMIATDVYDGRRYENKNVEFSKIQKSSIIAALQDKNKKQIECKVSQEVVQKKQDKSEQTSFLRQKCLRIKFTVTLQYILPFSQSAILYEVQSFKKILNMVPKKLTKQAAKQYKKQIEQLQAAIPNENEKEEQNFQIYQVGNMTLQQNKNDEDIIIIGFIAYNAIVIILWILYFTFLESLGLCVLSIGILWLYFSTRKHLVKQIQLKKGTYKVEVSGMVTVQNYTQNHRESMILHAQFNQWKSEKLKIYINNMSGYAYPYNGTMLIKSNKNQTLSIKIQKNVKMHPVSIQNTIITVQKLSPLIQIH